MSPPLRPFSRAREIGTSMKNAANMVTKSCKQQFAETYLSLSLDPKGYCKDLGKSACKGALKKGPGFLVEIGTLCATTCAVQAAGGSETQVEGACALSSVGTGAVCGACVGGPLGAAVAAGAAGAVEGGVGVCKIGYYTTTSFCEYGVRDSFRSWCEEGYNPIRNWFD